jgi:hypothetical protein
MPNKFKIGEQVIIKKIDSRTPKELLASLRLDHHRTIVATFYDKNTQHTRYYLGSNKRGEVDLSYIHFRASQLKLWVKGRIGHPRTKRRYRRHHNKSLGIV